MTSDLPFNSLYRHGYARVSTCVPRMRVAAPSFNAEQTIALAREAADDGSVLAIFPEMGLSGYSCEDLFHQDALLDATEQALEHVVEQSETLPSVLVVGAPLRFESKLFNCAIVVHRGRVLGVVPKTYLPNYREFYEQRQFTPGTSALSRGGAVRLLGTDVPFGDDLLFSATDLPGFVLFTEICEDVWVPLAPSTFGAMAGATVLANLSASNITIGKAAYRRNLCASQSGKCIAAYLYSAAGRGESTTDLAWDGHALIYENSNLLAESERFSDREQRITADVDLDRLRQERMRFNTFGDCVANYREKLGLKGLLKWAIEWEADGVIGRFEDDEEAQIFTNAGIPVVAQDYKERLHTVPNITSSYFETGKLGADVDARLRVAVQTTQAQLDAAERARRAFTAAVDRALENTDVLVLPTLPALPITIEAARNGTPVLTMSSLIRPFNLSGHPALSLPIPIEGSPMKAGLQIVGRKGADEEVCAVAAHFEAALAAS